MSMLDLINIFIFSCISYFFWMKPDKVIEVFYGKGLNRQRLRKARMHVKRMGILALGILVVLILKVIH